MLNAFLNVLLTPRLLWTIGAVLASVLAFLRVRRHFQMFQQNSYFPSRYFGWLKTARSEIIVDAVVFLLYFLLFQTNAASPDDESDRLAVSLLLALAADVALLIALIPVAVHTTRQHRRSVIRLVMTARMRRMYGTLIVVWGAMTVLQATVGGDRFFWFFSVCMLCMCFPFLSVLLAYTLTWPVEKLINRGYIRSAKKRLAGFGNRLTVIGITGSFGKTGTKAILTAMLSERYLTCTTPKNYNTPMGIVRTIREHLPVQTQIFVCEMGAKKPGDIKELCDLVHPSYGLITSVGPQHLDTFGNIETVCRTKFELYQAVKAVQGETFANLSSEPIARQAATLAFTPYGTPETPYYADALSYSSKGQSFTLHLDGETVDCHTRLLGAHAVTNIVGAAALAHRLGLSAADISRAVAKLTPVEHRLELKRYIGGSQLIDDAYNANPEGSLEACRVIGRFEAKRRIIVTPGLVELGQQEEACNRRLGAEAAANCDVLILVGKQRSVPLKAGALQAGFKGRLQVVDSFAAAKDFFTPLLDPETVILFENDLPDNYLQ